MRFFIGKAWDAGNGYFLAQSLSPQSYGKPHQARKEAPERAIFIYRCSDIKFP